MITRPLDLASRLRPPPRSFDWLFFVNAGLIVLFFSLFGSRFVLAPGVAIDFQLPEVAGARAAARPTTHYVRVTSTGQIFAGDGLRDLAQLRIWLEQQAKTNAHPTLLIQASSSVRMSIINAIVSAATAAGFSVQYAAAEPVAPVQQTRK
jgi:biopolymer transport protein ExbD